MASEKTIREGCGKRRAGGGHRFCWSCLCDVLSSQPVGTSEANERAHRAAAKRMLANKNKKRCGALQFTYA